MVGFILVLLLACVSVASASRTGPVFLAQTNVVCEDIIPGYEGSMFETGSSSGTFANSDGFSVTVDVTNSQNIGWNSNYPVDAVIAKDGGNYVNYYLYDPGQTGDTGLMTPFNPAGIPGGVSHLRFCYTPEVPVPEFPTFAFPVALIIGIVGTVLFIRGTRKN